MTTFIYHLLDEGGNVRYVGKTIDPVLRLKQHLACCKSNAHLRNWIKQQILAGHPPVMRIVRECPAEEWKAAEIAEIGLQRRLGAPLCNKTCGGGAGFRRLPSMLTRDKCSATHRKRWASSEYRESVAFRRKHAKRKRRVLLPLGTVFDAHQKIRDKRRLLHEKYFSQLPQETADRSERFYLTDAFIRRYFDELV